MANEIDRNDYLKALGLFHLASEACSKTTEYEKALTELLGVEVGSHVTDAVWGGGDFDEALELEKITVKDTLSQ